MIQPTYNELLVELVATLDALVYYANTPDVKKSAVARRSVLIKLHGKEEAIKDAKVSSDIA